MKNRWIKLLCLCLAACLCLGALAGCGGKKDQESAPPSESAPVESAPVDYAKYNAYSALLDEMNAMEEVLSVYFQNVAYEEEFALVEGGDYANIKETAADYTGFSYTAQAALEYAGEEPAYPEADAAVLALGTSVEEVMDALGHLGSYMRFDEYVDDNMARAPELHAELWAALQTYDAHAPELRNAMSALDKQTDEENLEQLRENGEMILYQSWLFMNAGEAIQNEVWDQLAAALDEAPEGENLTLPAIDMTALAPLVDQFNTAYNDLTAALGDQTELEKVPKLVGQHGETVLNIYQNRVDGMYVKTGELVQAMQEGSDYGEALDGMSEALENLISAYNNVI